MLIDHVSWHRLSPNPKTLVFTLLPVLVLVHSFISIPHFFFFFIL